MNKEELKQRLLDFDERVSLEEQCNPTVKYKCFLVGGSAFILLNLMPRATYDIDVLRCTSRKLLNYMQEYGMNTNVSAYIGCFADGFAERAIKLELNTHTVDFYTLSLEDLVVSKIASGRTKDMKDIQSRIVLNNIDWEKLDELIDLTSEGMISDFSRRELIDLYEEYRREFKK